MASAYFAPLVLLPTVIDATGPYITRGGERVSILVVSHRHDFGCQGSYSNGAREGWHKSGRLFADTLSQNDIVSKAEA